MPTHHNNGHAAFISHLASAADRLGTDAFNRLVIECTTIADGHVDNPHQRITVCMERAGLLTAAERMHLRRYVAIIANTYFDDHMSIVSRMLGGERINLDGKELEQE